MKMQMTTYNPRVLVLAWILLLAVWTPSLCMASFSECDFYNRPIVLNKDYSISGAAFNCNATEPFSVNATGQDQVEGLTWTLSIYTSIDRQTFTGVETTTVQGGNWSYISPTISGDFVLVQFVIGRTPANNQTTDFSTVVNVQIVSNSRTGRTIGIALGVVLGVVLIALVSFFIYRRHLSRQSSYQSV